MKNILYLTLICVVSAICLATIHQVTKHTRVENRKQYENRQLVDILPSGTPEEICRQKFESYRSDVEGYGGLMNIAVVFKESKLIGVRVLSHTETPGFADILEVANWIGRFGKEPLERIDAVTRATITSNAVLAGVKEVLERKSSGWSPCN